MEIFRHIEDPRLSVSGSVVTLGNFDGIHLGHQALIRSIVEAGKRLASLSVVLTFEPHPLKVLAPDRAPKLILTHKDKMRLFQSLGVDIVVIQTFDAAFANVEAEDFVRTFVVERLKTKEIWVGRDLRFGKGRKGSVNDLIRWGNAFGFTVGTIEPIVVEGIRVSSSRIRELVEQGRVDEAMPLLGRYHFISGKVARGRRRGRDLGFPTANIASRNEVLPLDGIYATLLQIRDKQLLSVSSIGMNPTFGEGPRTIESFILDFDHDIYSESVKLSFVKRIREEKKFDSVDQLVAQMDRDVSAAKAVFNQLNLTGTDGLAGC
jgi:riboflavin kinase/FMN adenylyltransferase